MFVSAAKERSVRAPDPHVCIYKHNRNIIKKTFNWISFTQTCTDTRIAGLYNQLLICLQETDGSHTTGYNDERERLTSSMF